ncbi:MAG: hypothetical protein A2W90_18765 [Bacteroidetes bacterium GWF2_42_66]|nr:MAG: hypothetical protein A2W92_05570 [Bacteroidetes bacterium GWA2_42_15]OFX98783.1 MAG: hypothetical protein A2W89_10930 [Bacteroidetes bacterium GWE2_42_39]OFY43020.1 MAG: hypothetical protein A2W90_18765 [Bacteroidetes bacterium GWF2_42_66]HBL77143.1 hypothetical protein [Prolixibacteraceae bacterium]HCR91434.1 hypothetical protein [Prolixibacteraceae bacterium]
MIMKKNYPIFSVTFFIVLIAFFFTLNVGTSYSQDKPTLSSGVAKVNITPKEKIPIGWHSGENKPNDGIHDEVFSRAIVFSNGVSKAAIISVDISGISNSAWEELTNRIEKETGIPQKYIMLCATHTHSGPAHNLAGYGKNTSPEVASYTVLLKDNIVKSVKDALSNLKPANIGAGKGECKMNINRRAPMAVGGLWLGKNPDGSCDHEVAVLKINDEKGNTEGLFINWPCHGTVMGPTSGGNLLTGDWLGATALFVEKEFANGIVVPVTAGASGDIDPIIGPHGTEYNDKRIHSDIFGILVGKEAIRVANEIGTTSINHINAAQRTVTLPGKKSYREMPELSFDDLQKIKPGSFTPSKDVLLRLSAIKVGNIIFAGISGEMFHEIGMNLKKQSPYTQTFILTHCNGSCGYIPTDKAYYEMSYEVAASVIMSGGEQAIMKNLIEMVNEL